MNRQSGKRPSSASIINLYVNDGFTTAAIAEQTGYSRQRIGQILRAAGIDVVLHSQGRRKATMQAKARARMQAAITESANRNAEQARIQEEQDMRRYREWRLLWANGEPASKIAEFENRPLEAIKGTIRRLRIRYGWFAPRRKVCTEHGLPKNT